FAIANLLKPDVVVGGDDLVERAVALAVAFRSALPAAMAAIPAGTVVVDQHAEALELLLDARVRALRAGEVMLPRLVVREMDAVGVEQLLRGHLSSPNAAIASAREG